ncbi:MAG TPA: NAD(P)H-hydrate dehydratase [Terriglobales bacterium]|nr:NAD(P)H-hydrate dehydratase [Terriglobales bacterium]
MKITTAEEMREIDRDTSERFGVPSLTLMENAGTAVADFATSHFGGARRVGIVCGKGNNGGDGFVAARKLSEAFRQVEVLLLADPEELKGDAAEMFGRMKLQPVVARDSAGLRTSAAQQVFQGDLIIDAILGTGFRPPVTGLYAEAIAAMNASGRPVLAVDIPSGADADAFTLRDSNALRARADGIVTFTAPRPAHVFAELTRGETMVAPIGSPAEAIASDLRLHVIRPADFADFVALRPAEGQKGNYGHALVIGGSVGKAGAAAMAGISALRSGAGLSTVATAKSVLPTVAGFHPELMSEPLAETDAGTISLAALDYGRLDGIAGGKDVIALGPGISRNPDTVQFVRAVVDKYPTSIVVDADGLNAFEKFAHKLSGRSRLLVLTPHPGEMSRLTGLSISEIQQDRIGVARKFACEHHCVLVLKGHRTLVAFEDGNVWANVTGNPGMASGGSGDILTGMIAGFVAQAKSVDQPDAKLMAVLAAVYLHGLGGDFARERLGEHSLIASDILAGLPQAFEQAREDAREERFSFHG